MATAQPPLVGAVIVGYGPEPPGSGLIMFHRMVTVRMPDGAERDLAMIWAAPGLYFDDRGTAPIAVVGSICTIAYHSGFRPEVVSRPGDNTLLDAVDHMDCRTGTGEPADTVPVVFEDATIISFSPPVGQMPMFSMHRSVTARQKSGSTLDLEFLWDRDKHFLSRDGRAPLPSVGAVCDITYRISRTAGPRPTNTALIDRFDCR